MPAKKMLLATGLMAVTFFTACNSNRDPDFDDYAVNTVNAVDLRFIQNASESNHAEMMTSEVAQDHYNDPIVANFARMMYVDHRFAQEDLNKRALKRNVETPTFDYVDSASYKYYDSLRKMATMKGMSKTKEFDRTYMNIQKAMHQKAINLFRAEVNNTSGDSTIRGYAQMMLPKIENHLRMADSVILKLR